MNPPIRAVPVNTHATMGTGMPVQVQVTCWCMCAPLSHSVVAQDDTYSQRHSRDSCDDLQDKRVILGLRNESCQT